MTFSASFGGTQDIWAYALDKTGISSAEGILGSWTPATTGKTALRFVPIAPCRIADTRNPAGAFGSPALVGQVPRDFVIPNSACGIPASAQSYSLNATVVPHGQLGYLTIWPSGQTQPLVSTLNSDGRIKANAAIVPAGVNGAISVFATNTTDFVLDIDGYFVPASLNSGLLFYSTTLCRVSDTRNPSGQFGGPYLAASTVRVIPVQSSACNIPASAQAYSFSITAVPRGPLGYLTAFPTGSVQPLVSTLNSPTGAVTANAALLQAGTGGAVSVFASNDTDFVIDINGYFGPPGPGGLSLYAVTPCRVLDTRVTVPPEAQDFIVPVLYGPCPVPRQAQAYIFNATVVPQVPLDYLTLWPGGMQPSVSTLNAGDGAVTSNMTLVPTVVGQIVGFASNATYLIMDILGYFAP